MNYLLATGIGDDACTLGKTDLIIVERGSMIMNIFFSRHNYVRADKVMKLRHLLDKLGNIPGMMSEEKGQVNSIQSHCQHFLQKPL